jgi:hypothetical protein
MRLPLRSLMLLLDVVDLVLKANRRLQDVETLATRLETAVFAYLEATLAYGSQAMKHKHHELTHLADQLRRDGILLWCFTTERKHIIAKAVMAHCRTMTAFGLGSVSRMFTSQIACLSQAAWLSRLHLPQFDFPEFATAAKASCCRISRSMRWMQTEIRHGYPLYVGLDRSILVLVVACIIVDGCVGVVGNRCNRVRGDAISSDWKVHAEIDHHALVSTDYVEVARAWRKPHGDCLTVLH